MSSFMGDLERQARAAARAEADFRLEVRDRLAQLEATRIAAYRRLNLLRGMLEAVSAVDEAAAAIDAGIDYACRCTGWSETDQSYAELRERLRPTADAMQAARLATTPGQEPPSPQAPLLAFAGFEAWYQARFGADFLALMASDAPTFQSVVDF
ncbi:MAG: hypothetical protein KIT36_05875 [Alphaproteobacteria bacterium]|nr:hypothetical protein [Alphaproteobacteria bacterium]